jgi:DNA-binding transcriptional MerR regulator
MSRDLTIQQAAERTGLSTHTLRYYERVNLLPSIERATNGHRRYSEQDLRWIEFVKRLRSTGMPICEVQHYLETYEQGDAGIAERLEIMEAHRHRLMAKIEELDGFLMRIEAKVENYRARVAQQKAATR